MDVQLKAGMFRKDTDLAKIKFEDIFHADPNTRYSYTIAAIAKNEKAYSLYRKGKPCYYKFEEEKIRVLPLWPDKKVCQICQKKDEVFNSTEIWEIGKKELYFEVLSNLHKRRNFVSIYLNLENTIELPAREFKIDWFEYMFYELKQDWMFDE